MPKSKRPIHFIWSGPPPIASEGGVPGHDILGPVQMASHVDTKNNEIIFWCLEEHLTHYQHKFHGMPITVQAIEPYLRDQKIKETETPYAAEILLLISKLLETQERGEIRDYVTVKELMAFYLLYETGGYVLDTNILPNTGHAITFPEYDRFMLPAHGNATANARKTDIWMMYAPPQHSRYAERALSQFLQSVTYAEEGYFHPEMRLGYIAEFFEHMGKAGVTAATSDPHGLVYPNSAIIGLWETTKQNAEDETYYSLVVPELGLTKFYYNTHKFERFLEHRAGVVVPHDQLHQEVIHGHLENIKIMCSENPAVVNRCISNESYTNLSPLHAAIIFQQVTIAKWLLANGADTKARFQVNDEDELESAETVTIFQLIQTHLPPDAAAELTDLIRGHHAQRPRGSPVLFKKPVDFSEKEELQLPDKPKKEIR